MMKLIRFCCRFSFIILLIAAGCIEPYNPPVVQQDTHYLVADAYLNSDNGVITVILSRTQPLYSTDPPPPELKAVVTLEDEQGTVYAVPEQGKGQYTGNGLSISTSKKYRVHIRTSGKEDFFSQYISVKTSPEVDDVFWLPERDGIFIYVDTHDPSGNSRYYKWTYSETWEYTSTYPSGLKIKEGGEVVTRGSDETIYTCWRTMQSTGIFVGTSSRLQDDVIRQYPLIFLPRGSIKLSRKYSVNVQQKAITEEAYNYWLQLEQTTEKLGGLFDPMPSQITGNFYNATDPTQPALGFFSGGSVREKRMFVSFGDLPNHLQLYPRTDCVMDTIPVNEIVNYGPGTLLISSFGDPFPVGYLTSSNACIDCRSFGGTTVKPLFWK
jgi:hypothetical protein